MEGVGKGTLRGVWLGQVSDEEKNTGLTGSLTAVPQLRVCACVCVGSCSFILCVISLTCCFNLAQPFILFSRRFE